MGELPVAVIGAGPLGLAAAAHLLERGLEPVVLESGDGPADAIREWGHVHLFSPWPELVDQAGLRLLEPSGWSMPSASFPTGSEWVSGYLAPLAAALGGRVRYSTRVTGVSRRGLDRLSTAGRAEQPFVLHLADHTGAESLLEARAVIDASGTWRQPNPWVRTGCRPSGSGSPLMRAWSPTARRRPRSWPDGRAAALPWWAAATPR